MSTNNKLPLPSDNNETDSEVPEIFSVSEKSGNLAFTRRSFIEVAGTAGVSAAVLSVAGRVAGQDTACTISPVTSGVEIHEEPSSDSDVLGRLRRGQEFAVLEVAENEDEELWFRIEIPNARTDSNWVIISTDIEITGDCSEFLAATAPASEPCFVMTDEERGVQVHVGPGRNRGVRAWLPANEEFMVIGRADDSDGDLWYKIDMANTRLSGQETWVFSGDVETIGGCDQLGAAEIPPIIPITQSTPTNTPEPDAPVQPDGPTPEPVDPGNPGDTPEGQEGINYTSPDGHRFTLPCGSPIPPGAVCTCNCVTVPVGGNNNNNNNNNDNSPPPPSHYWYPN